ncbi:MAG: hypothetical protein ACRDQX_14035 [Pseudonocardiaceae bacterium]
MTRMGGNLARTLGATAVIVGIQWAVLALTTDKLEGPAWRCATRAVRSKLPAVSWGHE